MYHEWDRRGTCIGYWWKSQNERPLGRPRHRWVDNIKMDLGERRWGGMDWIDLAQGWVGAVEVFCEHGNEPSGLKNRCEVFFSSYIVGSPSRRCQLHEVS
jgi:hypothetical protein